MQREMCLLMLWLGAWWGITMTTAVSTAATLREMCLPLRAMPGGWQVSAMAISGIAMQREMCLLGVMPGVWQVTAMAVSEIAMQREMCLPLGVMPGVWWGSTSYPISEIAMQREMCLLLLLMLRLGAWWGITITTVAYSLTATAIALLQ